MTKNLLKIIKPPKEIVCDIFYILTNEPTPTEPMLNDVENQPALRESRRKNTVDDWGTYSCIFLQERFYPYVEISGRRLLACIVVRV